MTDYFITTLTVVVALLIATLLCAFALMWL
jgi:hypothetical protein